MKGKNSKQLSLDFEGKVEPRDKKIVINNHDTAFVKTTRVISLMNKLEEKKINEQSIIMGSVLSRISHMLK